MAPDQIDSTIAVQEDTGLFGLTLKKSKSLLDLVEMKLSHQNVPQKGTIQSANFEKRKLGDDAILYHQNVPLNKLKASSYHAILLKIGKWERTSKYEGDVVAKCYFAKQKLVWEILDFGLKRKIEMSWSDISAIRATFADGQPDILEVELKDTPQFFNETNPQPRKHTNWESADDFTGGEAPIIRRHCLKFTEGSLQKHYEKLLHYDSRLFELSQRPFPSSSSQYFERVLNGMQHIYCDMNMHRPDFLPAYNQQYINCYPSQIPRAVITRTNATCEQIGNFEPFDSYTYQMPFLGPTQHRVMDMKSPSSGIDFPPVNEQYPNFSVDQTQFHSATTFPPNNHNSAMNQVCHEATPSWNQEIQHQMPHQSENVYDALASESQENQEHCWGDDIADIAHSNNSINDMQEPMLDYQHLGHCEPTMMTKMDYNDRLISPKTQYILQLEDSNRMDDGKYGIDSENAHNASTDFTQSDTNEDMLTVNLPHHLSNNFAEFN